MAIDVSRAWRDAAYFNALSEAEKAQVPANPAGIIDLQLADLHKVAGARAAASCTGTTCCTDSNADVCSHNKTCKPKDSLVAL